MSQIEVNWKGLPRCPICKSDRVMKDDESQRYGCNSCTFVWRVRRQ